MANQRKSNDGDDAICDEQLELLQLELEDAIAGHDGSQAAIGKVARLQQQVWNQLSLALQRAGRFIEAAKASTEAVSHGKLAISADKATHGDRIAALERAVKDARSAGRGIRDAARRRKK